MSGGNDRRTNNRAGPGLNEKRTGLTTKPGLHLYGDLRLKTGRHEWIRKDGFEILQNLYKDRENQDGTMRCIRQDSSRNRGMAGLASGQTYGIAGAGHHGRLPVVLQCPVLG